MTIHPLSDVQTAQIGANTTVWQYSVILKNARIGENCNINCHTFVENDVVIGNNVTLKPGVYLWDGMVLEDNVFVGPNATFVNDKYPRSKQYPESFQKTRLCRGCSIGANATVLGNVTIGEYAIIGAGSVVTKDIPPYALVTGNPGRVVGWLDRQGRKLEPDGAAGLRDAEGNRYRVVDNRLQPA